jgi:para-nitrobenzyl esterase
LPFVSDNFECWSDAGMLRDLDLAGARALAQQVQHALLNFVERGDPNGEGVPQWPAYNEHEKPELIFGGVKGSI